MLERCQAYLIARTPIDIAGLHNVVRGAGFLHSVDVATGDGSIDPSAKIRFFFVHFRIADREILSSMKAVRTSADDSLRFSPFILIADDCPFEDIIKYVHLGFDDVISLPEKSAILRHRLEAFVANEQTYFETQTYFGPDRSRMELAPVDDKRHHPHGGQHVRYRIRRDPLAGVKIVQQVFQAT